MGCLPGEKKKNGSLKGKGLGEKPRSSSQERREGGCRGRLGGQKVIAGERGKKESKKQMRDTHITEAPRSQQDGPVKGSEAMYTKRRGAGTGFESV